MSINLYDKISEYVYGYLRKNSNFDSLLIYPFCSFVQKIADDIIESNNLLDSELVDKYYLEICKKILGISIVGNIENLSKEDYRLIIAYRKKLISAGILHDFGISQSEIKEAIKLITGFDNKHIDLYYSSGKIIIVNIYAYISPTYRTIIEEYLRCSIPCGIDLEVHQVEGYQITLTAPYIANEFYQFLIMVDYYDDEGILNENMILSLEYTDGIDTIPSYYIQANYPANYTDMIHHVDIYVDTDIRFDIILREGWAITVKSYMSNCDGNVNITNTDDESFLFDSQDIDYITEKHDTIPNYTYDDEIYYGVD